MKKMILILAVATGFYSCTSQGGIQGDPTSDMMGANIGGLVGGIVGDSVDGRHGPGATLFGSLIGTITGAALASAATSDQGSSNTSSSSRYNEGYYVDETYHYSTTEPETSSSRYNSSRYRGQSQQQQGTDLTIKNIRFIDSNRNQKLDAEESAQIIFEVVNRGQYDVYNVTPFVTELNEIKHLYISPSASVECIPAGDGIRYTANIRTDKKLKSGEALFQIMVVEGNGGTVFSRTFAIPTQDN